MKKAMTYNHYLSFPVKGRILWSQKRLSKLGYDKVPINGKRDRNTVKAMTDFQARHGITPNGVVDIRTFQELDKIEIDDEG